MSETERELEIVKICNKELQEHFEKHRKLIESHNESTPEDIEKFIGIYNNHKQNFKVLIEDKEKALKLCNDSPTQGKGMSEQLKLTNDKKYLEESIRENSNAAKVGITRAYTELMKNIELRPTDE